MGEREIGREGERERGREGERERGRERDEGKGQQHIGLHMKITTIVYSDVRSDPLHHYNRNKEQADYTYHTYFTFAGM